MEKATAQSYNINDDFNYYMSKGPLGNPVFFTICVLFFIAYTSVWAPQLPNNIKDLFSKPWVRAVSMVFAAYLGTKNIILSLLSTLLLLVTFQVAQSHQDKKDTMAETMANVKFGFQSVAQSPDLFFKSPINDNRVGQLSAMAQSPLFRVNQDTVQHTSVSSNGIDEIDTVYYIQDNKDVVSEVLRKFMTQPDEQVIVSVLKQIDDMQVANGVVYNPEDVREICLKLILKMGGQNDPVIPISEVKESIEEDVQPFYGNIQ